MPMSENLMMDDQASLSGSQPPSASRNEVKKTREKASNRKKLATRRAIEDYLESRRMREQFGDFDLDD